MSEKPVCVMLVDDNEDDNYVHERVIRKSRADSIVISKTSASGSLDYLSEKDLHTESHPNIIFLDINMPGMNGWEFIAEYKKLDIKLQSEVVIVMLTTSENPTEKTKSKAMGVVVEFRTKPLTTLMFEDILRKFGD